MPMRVVLDTNVLYPRYLRIPLLRFSKSQGNAETSLVAERLYLPLWSADILGELRRSLRRGGISNASVYLILAVMRRNHPAAEVSGYQHLVDSMTCDPSDRHVLAAAVHAEVDAIVTQNVRDFPSSSVDPYGVSVVHPDDFLLNLFADAAEHVVRELELLARAAKSGEPASLEELAVALRRAGAPRFASVLEDSVG